MAGPASSLPLPIPSPVKQMIVTGRLGDRASWPYSPDLCFWVFSEVGEQVTEALVGDLEGGGEHQPRGSSHELPAPPTPLIHSTAAPPSLDPPAASLAPGPSVGAQLCNLGQASADAHPSRLGGHENYCGFLSTLVSPACGCGFQLALHLLHFTSVFPSQLLPGPGASSSNITQEDSMFAETTEWAPTLPEVRSQGQSHCCPSVSPSSWFCSSDCAWTLQVGLLMGMTSWGGTPGPRKCLAHAEVVILKLGACT